MYDLKKKCYLVFKNGVGGILDPHVYRLSSTSALLIKANWLYVADNCRWVVASIFGYG